MAKGGLISIRNSVKSQKDKKQEKKDNLKKIKTAVETQEQHKQRTSSGIKHRSTTFRSKTDALKDRNSKVSRNELRNAKRDADLDR